jgi:hypothetical protein
MTSQLVNPQCLFHALSKKLLVKKIALVFIKNRSNQWRCTICPDSDFKILSKAVVHEDFRSHVTRVRQLDRVLAPISSPLRAPSETEDYFSTASSPSETPPTPFREPTEDLFGGRPAVHGPALPTDDPDQIYDDFGGEVGHNRPLPESLDDLSPEDYDDYLDLERDSPRSDGSAHWDQPESDGLFNAYNDQLAEEQRRKSALPFMYSI